MFMVETEMKPRRAVEADIARTPQWLGNGLHDEGIQVRLPAEAMDFLFPQRRPQGQWSPPGLLFSAYRCLFFGRREVNHLSPSSAEVKNACQ